MLKKTIFVAGILAHTLIYCQFQNPSSVKWKQIKTDNFIYVFPEEVEEKGILTANLLEVAFKPVRNSLRVATPRTTVFLYNQSVISNGFTSLVPRQIVFYSTPPQDAQLVGGTDWLQTLTLHEYRHAVQFAKLDNHFTNFIGGFFGPVSKAVLMNVSVPFWVFEGDAVCSETAFSLEGRGRLPSFVRAVRALELDNTRYNYYKAYLGSYKDYFPNHYHLGYLMTSHIRNNYGDQVWNKTLSRTSKFSFWPWTFSRSLKKYTRSSVQRTYNNTLNEYGNIWRDNQQRILLTEYEDVNIPEKKIYTNYSFPYSTDDGKIVAVKSGFGDAQQLVLLETDGREQLLTMINPLDRVHSNGKVVVWSTEYADIRWGERSYSDIIVYNLEDGKKERITKKGKYYAPAVSPDGSFIAAVRYNSDMECQLVILDSKTGTEKNVIDFRDNSFVRMPSWSDDSKTIVFTVSKEQVRNISVFDLKDNSIKNITEFSTESITNPICYKDYIIYNSTISGVDAIYALNLVTKEKYYVVSEEYGSYDPSISPDGKNIIFQHYTSLGNNLGTTVANPDKWKKVKEIEYAGDNYYQHMVDLEKGTSIFDSLETGLASNYKINNYRPLLHSIDLVGWALYPVPNGVGLGVMSDDKLNTTQFTAGVNYFPDAKAHREFLNLQYSRYFPVIELMAHYGRLYATENDTSSSLQYRQTDEKILRAGIILPFNFSRGTHLTNLNLNAAYNFIYKNVPADSLFESSAEEKVEISALEIGLKFLHYGPMAKRDIYPRFGQSLNVIYWNTPFGTGTEGDRFSGNAILYLPGLTKHHSISLIGGYEKSSSAFREGVYKLTTAPEFVRGYQLYYSDEFKKATIVYSLPLAYPDLAIGPILYCQRITTGVFYDHGILNYDNSDYTFRSVGFDLNFNINLFNLLVPLEMGLRASYLIDDDKLAFEFLIFSNAL